MALDNTSVTCNSVLRITAEHLRDNKTIGCDSCNNIVTLHDADRSIEGYTTAEEIERSMKRRPGLRVG